MNDDTTQTPRIAVIGSGQWGRHHVRIWHEMGVLEAVVDPDPAALAAVRESFPGISVFGSLDPVLANPAVTAVVVASPAATHHDVARLALEAGKHVLVEKPLTLSARDGAELVRLARSRELVLMVGHLLVFHPAVRKLEELVSSGAMGRLHYIYAHRLNMGRIRTAENALWSFAPHDIAILERLVGSPPEDVSCHGGSYLGTGVADVTVTNLVYPRGVRAHIFVSWLHPFKEHRIIVVGERQMAVFDDTRSWDRKLCVYPHRVDWKDGQIPVANKALAEPVKLDEVEPLAAECVEFLTAVREQRAPQTDGESGVRVLEVLETAQRSLESSGASIRVDSAEVGYWAHPTATIDPGARIGRGTKIWHHTHVMPGASLGEKCVIGQNVFCGRGVKIGRGTKVQNNVSVYEGVTLEDDVFCGPSVTFTNVLNPRAAIEKKNEFRSTLVRRGATLGANATIVCGHEIGEYAFVAAGAVVTRDVPAHALVMGNPARVVGHVCRCGERLDRTADPICCAVCGERYRGDRSSLRLVRAEAAGS